MIGHDVVLETLLDYANKALTVSEVERRLKERFLADPRAGAKALAPYVCRGYLEDTSRPTAAYQRALDKIQRSILRHSEAWQRHYESALVRLALEDPGSAWLDTLVSYAGIGILARQEDILMDLAATLPREQALARRAVERAMGELGKDARMIQG